MIWKLFCRIGWCLRCRPYSTEEGIGGKCINPKCGKVHGWVSREDLRKYLDYLEAQERARLLLIEARKLECELLRAAL